MVKKRGVVLVHQQTRINSNIHNVVIYSLSALLATLGERYAWLGDKRMNPLIHGLHPR